MKKIYLDQCVVSNLCVNPDQPWQDTKIGSVLVEGTANGKCEVWVSPANVLETLLCADYEPNGQLIPSEKLNKRTRIARTLLDLCDAKRMSPSYEFLLVREFVEFLRQLAPDCLRTERLFKMLERMNQQNYLGILALLVAYPQLDRPESVEKVVRAKITSQLLQSRFARDPGSFAAQIIECAKEFRLTSDDIWSEFDSRSISDLQSEIAINLSAAVELSGTAKAALQKNKTMIADAYGASEIGECLSSVFEDFYLLLATFDIFALKQNWESICQTIGKTIGMPKSLALSDEVGCADENVASEALGHFFRHVSRGELLSPRIVNQIVIGELEMCLTKGRIPTGGLGFDAEHAAILPTMNVFVTSDIRLQNLARRAAQMIKNATKGHHSVAVVGDAGELAAQIL